MGYGAKPPGQIIVNTLIYYVIIYSGKCRSTYSYIFYSGIAALSAAAVIVTRECQATSPYPLLATLPGCEMTSSRICRLSSGHEDRPETDQDYADPEVSLHFLPQKQPRSERNEHSI
jgi:hypothetical protein